MEDPREIRRHRSKKKWVQVAAPHQEQEESEPDRIVGRDIAYNVESTTPASCVQKIKTSVENAQNTNTENEISATDQEVAERLTTLQAIFESGQRDINARLDKLFSYSTKELQARDAAIAKLKITEKTYHSLESRHHSLERDYHALQDRSHTFKLLCIVSSTLFFILMALSIFVCIYPV